MIVFSANTRKATATTDDAITTRSVGIPVSLVLSSEFDGLAKTLCAKNGTAAVDVVLVGDAVNAVLPPDVLLTTGQLQIGIYAADDEGNIVIPTVWALVGQVKQGAMPSGVDPLAPSPSWVAQVQNIASEAIQNSEQAIETANEAKEAAITAQDSAQASASAAAQSATNAENSAVAAAGSETDASESADAAAGSASTASTKAGEAAASATTASGAAATATAQAGNASDSAAAAAQSASEAEASAETASTKAGEASTSATAAAGSASTATQKASEAAQSATQAAGSASSASSSATAASTARTGAETAQTAAETAAQSVSASAAQIQQNTEDITDLKSQFDASEITVYSKNRFNIASVEAGYVNQATGAWVPGGTTYKGTPDMIDVLRAPFVLTFFRYAGSINLTFRYAVYDEAGNYITGAIVPKDDFTIIGHPTVSSQSCGYLVFSNENIRYIRFSLQSGYFDSLPIQIEQGTAPSEYKPYTGDIRTAAGMQIANSSVIGDKGVLFHNSFISSGVTESIGIENSIKKNKVYHLHTLIDSTFDHLLFGHGDGAYSLYFDIDAANITFMTNGSAGTVLAHGLTLDTYIDFMLVVGDQNTGTIILNTLGGTYTKTVQTVQGYKGDVFVRPVGCTLGDTSMTFSSSDFRQPIWMFGDSYFTHTSSARWTYWLLEWGFGRCLLNGFPGANSDEALPQVIDYLGTWGIPKYIVWCLGMNDPDDGAINQSWLDCVTELIAQCRTYGVEPILSTIPNVPNLDHTYKNAWVRASGYRYVDFAKAVGAEQAGSTWYTGALSSDNTHPSEIGARLLCQQALLDVPELTLGNI